MRLSLHTPLNAPQTLALKLLLVLLLAMSLSSCGQKGGLTRPEQSALTGQVR